MPRLSSVLDFPWEIPAFSHPNEKASTYANTAVATRKFPKSAVAKARDKTDPLRVHREKVEARGYPGKRADLQTKWPRVALDLSRQRRGARASASES